MKHSLDDTIAAIITPRGEGGVGVIRISGSDALRILTNIFSPLNKEKNLKERFVTNGWIINAQKRKIDEVLAYYFKEPRSYTGEDVVEISCHGGLLMPAKILDLIINNGARVAERGEFSKRAFLNGKIDLLQAEAVLDLIAAKTDQGAENAARHLSGKLSARIKDLRRQIIDMSSLIEAKIDFPDDVEDQLLKAPKRIEEIVCEISKMIETAELGRIVREGNRVVLAGRPNVGKSSLLNAMIEEERAIVTADPGTTRDTVEGEMIEEGWQIRVIDTAGLREPREEAEEIGVNKAKKEIELADIVIIVLDGSQKLKSKDIELIESVKRAGKGQAIVVFNKIDLRREKRTNEVSLNSPIYFTSALTKEGVGGLKKGIIRLMEVAGGKPTDDGTLVNDRQKEALIKVKRRIERARDLINSDDLELAGLEVKEAVEALGEVDGSIVSEEVIARIFEKFCIGK